VRVISMGASSGLLASVRPGRQTVWPPSTTIVWAMTRRMRQEILSFILVSYGWVPEHDRVAHRAQQSVLADPGAGPRQ
jgi:hypothetical protein